MFCEFYHNLKIFLKKTFHWSHTPTISFQSSFLSSFYSLFFLALKTTYSFRWILSTRTLTPVFPPHSQETLPDTRVPQASINIWGKALTGLVNLIQAPFSLKCMYVLSHVQLFSTLWTVALQASLSMGFSRQESWSGLPFPPSGDLPDSGIKPPSSVSPVFQQVLYSLSHRGSPLLLKPTCKSPRSCAFWPMRGSAGMLASHLCPQIPEPKKQEADLSLWVVLWCTLKPTLVGGMKF